MVMQPSQKVIVVVEDEWLIRMNAADHLKSYGFEILEAGNSLEALEFLHLHHWAIALLFTDVHMPGDMNGLELARHARAHWPWIAILIASGQARLSQDDIPAGSRFLSKPYDIEHMAAHVRELVGV